MDLIVTISKYLSDHEIRSLDDNTCLFHDLYIFGDDAHELFIEIEEKFCVDFSDFIFEKYFPNDGYYLPLISHFLNKRKKKKFTIGHLKMIVSKGHWFEPQE